jgi:hypothetical protein
MIVTPEGFPLIYEIMLSNASDKTTLVGFLEHIEDRYPRQNVPSAFPEATPAMRVATKTAYLD